MNTFIKQKPLKLSVTLRKTATTCKRNKSGKMGKFAACAAENPMWISSYRDYGGRKKVLLANSIQEVNRMKNASLEAASPAVNGISDVARRFFIDENANRSLCNAVSMVLGRTVAAVVLGIRSPLTYCADAVHTHSARAFRGSGHFPLLLQIRDSITAHGKLIDWSVGSENAFYVYRDAPVFHTDE